MRAGLVAALSSDNMLWRLHAQRLLIERGQKDVVPQLIALTRNKSVDELGLNGGALHALWTLQGLGELANLNSEAGKAAVDALKHPAAGVRKAAAMVLPKTAEASERDRGRWPVAGSGSAHAARGDPGDCGGAGVTGARQAPLQGEREHRQLQRPVVEPRDVHRRHPAQGGVPRRVQGRRQRRADRVAADRAADRRDQA